MKALRFIPFAAAIFIILSCSNPISSSAAKSATSGSSTAQAAYAKLDVTDSLAWAAAVTAGDVRQGTVLVKTGTSFSSASLAALGATQTGSISVSALGGTWRHLSVAKGTEAATILALRTIKGVLVAEPEMRLHLPTNETRTKPVGLPSSVVNTSEMKAKSIAFGSSTYISTADGVFGTPLGPYIASAEYNLSVTNALTSYATYNPSTLTTTTYAAVLDTGLNMDHLNFYTKSGTLPIVAYAKSAFTNNGNGTYTSNGSSFVSVPIPSNWDDDGHGTHVAGILGAVGNNGVGIAGVMWSGLRLISYKVITDNEVGSDDSGSNWAVYGALEDLTTWWATAANHKDSSQVTLPVNISLGSYYASEFETEMIAYALKNNVVIIAAMGNDGKTTAEYPAAYTGVIAVGATNGDDVITPFSTSGSWIAVSAPGLDIISTYNISTSDYEYESGTSMATPFVTGLSAYTLAYAPMLPDQLKTVLMSSADLVGGETGFSTSYGAGRVDVLQTLKTAVSSSLPASGSVYSPYPISITVTVSQKPTSDIPVYLYDSNSNFVEVGYTGADNGYLGTVSFWLLKPGEAYTAKANYGGTENYAQVTVSTTTTATGIIAF
jgi:thermitase